MSRYFHEVMFLVGVMSSFTVVAQTDETRANEVRADAAISIQQGESFWAGQQVTLNLDLKTTGFSFANSHFNLPEISGAFLMQTDTTTVKMSERIDGETWQIVRYPLALYPQKAGRLEIPSIDVRFNTSIGFGSTVKTFKFKTDPLELTIKLPPGVKDGDLVVTTETFEFDYDWQPQSATAKTGDAITLKVSRRANDISAMLLPPLPVYRTDGLAAYPQAPEVSDKSNRGDLTGERIDSIIWVVEKPGLYEIPGIRFQWWDPNSRELKQQIIPGLSLDILPSPADNIVTDAGDGSVRSNKDFIWPLMTIFTFFTAALLWFRYGRQLPKQKVDTERSTFAALQKACSNNQPEMTHSALYEWLVWSAPTPLSSPGVTTLSTFASACGDEDLMSELAGLQEALITSDGHWQGSNLLSSLHRVRITLIGQRNRQSTAYLAPLNP